MSRLFAERGDIWPIIADTLRRRSCSAVSTASANLGPTEYCRVSRSPHMYRRNTWRAAEDSKRRNKSLLGTFLPACLQHDVLLRMQFCLSVFSRCQLGLVLELNQIHP